jgi:hypothetical protein
VLEVAPEVRDLQAELHRVQQERLGLATHHDATNTTHGRLDREHRVVPRVGDLAHRDRHPGLSRDTGQQRLQARTQVVDLNVGDPVRRRSHQRGSTGLGARTHAARVPRGQ